MFKKALAIAAVATALAVTPALAQHHGGGGGHFGGGGAHFGGGHFEGGHEHFDGGRHFGGERFEGGHFWHGRWWGYGVGPCWVWTPVGAIYNWVCD